MTYLLSLFEKQNEGQIIKPYTLSMRLLYSITTAHLRYIMYHEVKEKGHFVINEAYKYKNM
jgi:hypothetical protein